MSEQIADLHTEPPVTLPLPYPGSPNFPTDAELPSWLADYLDLVRPIGVSSDPVHLTALLPCMSAVVGPRAFQLSGALKLRPTIFALILGPSGIGGKSSAAKTAQSFTIDPVAEKLERDYGDNLVKCAEWEAADDGERGPMPRLAVDAPLRAPDDVTPAALHQCLVAQAQLEESERYGMMQYHDEFAKLLRMNASKPTESINQTLTSLYDCAPIDRARARGGKGGGAQKDRIEEPFMSLLGCSTPDWLADSIKGAEVAGGFLARFLIYESDVRPSTARIPAAVPPRPDEDRLQRWQDRTLSVFDGEIGGEWVFSEEAEAIYEAFYHDTWRNVIQIDGDDSDTRCPIAMRVLDSAKKLALLFEVFERSGQPYRDAEGRAIIGAAMAKCAIRVASFYLVEMLETSRTTLAPWWEAAERRYLDYLSDGPKPQNDCFQHVRTSVRRKKPSTGWFNQLVASLELAGKIVVERPSRPGGAAIHRLQTSGALRAVSNPG